MTVQGRNLDHITEHWAILAISEEERNRAFKIAESLLVEQSLEGLDLELPSTGHNAPDLLERVASAYEMAAAEHLDALLFERSGEEARDTRVQAEAAAFRAFELRRVLSLPEGVEDRIFHVLRLAGLSYAGDRWSDFLRWLGEHNVLGVEAGAREGADWDRRVLYSLYECWLRLLRKDGWDDLNSISEIVGRLRQEQRQFEDGFLDSYTEERELESSAYRLLALYHWARGTELIAQYHIQGEPAGIESILDRHFDAAVRAADGARDPVFRMLLRWLHVAAKRMARGSLWSAARHVNSRVTRFVEEMTRSKPFFEFLPPQRAAIQEKNLLDQAKRAVVVNLPTSGGKTMLAEFRILQALNQFEEAGGWVAYVAPTRALVSQLTRRLRRDFSAIGVQVEQLSASVEVGTIEERMLEQGDQDNFDVLVSTPEKLHMVIRGEEVERPLALVVLDEAHNIEDEARGLGIELLLATIMNDRPEASFLLLTPFVPNAEDLTNWLAPGEGATISFGTSAWRPNELIVGMFGTAEEAGSGDWSLWYESLLTYQESIELPGRIRVPEIRPLELPHSRVGKTKQAGAMAKVLSRRGTSIVVARMIRDAWSVARELDSVFETLDPVPDEVRLVQRYVASEVSDEFDLYSLLEKGIAVHHAGLSDETRTLIEWLAELGHLRVLCATTTIAQGINFPVSSVFLASLSVAGRYGQLMSKRSFWNLAGRCGRIGHDSVGVVGIAAGDTPRDVQRYVRDATEDLVSRLLGLLEDISAVGEELSLAQVIRSEKWADFRSYIAHLWNQKENLDELLAESEQVLRSTYGYSSLRKDQEEESQRRAEKLVEVTRGYARVLSDHPEQARLADATGFSPEGVRDAIMRLSLLEEQLDADEWEPKSLFGDVSSSALPSLIGVMMQVPKIESALTKLSGPGPTNQRIAEIAQAWVQGDGLEEIARRFFSGERDDEVSLTEALTKATRGIYGSLTYGATWGLSALAKMPTSGIDFETLSSEEVERINSLPAMLYHGVRSQEAVLMRMNSVPRSIAEPLGERFRSEAGEQAEGSSPGDARGFLRQLDREEWDEVTPTGSRMSGVDYQRVWRTLSGERDWG